MNTNKESAHTNKKFGGTLQELKNREYLSRHWKKESTTFKEWRNRRLAEKLNIVNFHNYSYNVPLSDEEAKYLKRFLMNILKRSKFFLGLRTIIKY